MAEAKIIQKESSFKTTAKNKNSTAFGLGQMIYSQRVKYSAKCDTTTDTTDPHKQVCMFRKYVQDRYRTPEKAWQFWLENNYY